jgi:hypothetical protein
MPAAARLLLGRNMTRHQPQSKVIVVRRNSSSPRVAVVSVRHCLIVHTEHPGHVDYRGTVPVKTRKLQCRLYR